MTPKAGLSVMPNGRLFGFLEKFLFTGLLEQSLCQCIMLEWYESGYVVRKERFGGKPVKDSTCLTEKIAVTFVLSGAGHGGR
jgi:hypothetical protein